MNKCFVKIILLKLFVNKMFKHIFKDKINHLYEFMYKTDRSSDSKNRILFLFFYILFSIKKICALSNKFKSKQTHIIFDT